MRTFARLTAAILAGLLLAACGEGDPAGSDTTATDRTAILAGAAAKRVLFDNSFGGEAPFVTVDVVEVVGRADEGGSILFDGGVVLDAADKEVITAALAPLTVRFVPTTITVDGPTPTPGRAVLSLSEPVTDSEMWTITTGLWCGDLCAIGGANEISHGSEGEWVIGAPVGPQWIA